MSKYESLAKEILANVGGKENINSLTHCVPHFNAFVKKTPAGEVRSESHFSYLRPSSLMPSLSMRSTHSAAASSSFARMWSSSSLCMAASAAMSALRMV